MGINLTTKISTAGLLVGAGLLTLAVVKDEYIPIPQVATEYSKILSGNEELKRINENVQNVNFGEEDLYIKETLQKLSASFDNRSKQLLNNPEVINYIKERKSKLTLYDLLGIGGLLLTIGSIVTLGSEAMNYLVKYGMNYIISHRTKD
ncbi:MAG: hypothetical protein AABX48_04820 [Nanoarchaeota archaeon]